MEKFKLTDTDGRREPLVVDTVADVDLWLRNWTEDAPEGVGEFIDRLVGHLERGEGFDGEEAALGIRVQRVKPFVVETSRTEYIAYQVWAVDEDDAGDRYGVDGEEVHSDITSEDANAITEGLADEVLTTD